MSGGAGAISVPAAVSIASKILLVSSVAIASIGVVSCLIGENGTQTSSKTTWKGEEKERLDVENPSPGNRDGQIHYHDSKGEKYMFDFKNNQFTDATNRLKELMSDEGFIKGLMKALKYLGENP